MAEITAPPAPPEITEAELQHQLQIQVVDVSSGVAANASDRADAYINEQTTERGIGGIAKRIWHGNIARDYIRQRQVRHGRDAIIESGNLYVLNGADQEQHDAAATAVVQRFTEGLLHGGEANNDISTIEHGADIQNQLRGLITEFASGTIEMPALEEERTRLMGTLGSTLRGQDREKGLLMADNVLEVAINARAAFGHGVGIDRIDSALSLKAGEARMGARTEHRRDAADRVVEKLQSSRVGSLVNETTVNAAVGIAFSIGKFTTRKVGMAIAATAGLGVGAGLMAGVRERLRIKQDRQLHGREMAEGGEIAHPGSDKRRAQLEATRYEARSAASLHHDLFESRNAINSSDSASMALAVANLAHVKTRIKLSDDMGADFITYDGKTNLEQQRLELDLMVAELEASLGTVVGEADEATLRAAGIATADVNETIDGMTNWTTDIMTTDMSDRDAVFQRVRRNRTIKMGLVGAATGIGIGLAIQEVKALAMDSVRGVFEHSTGNAHERRTLLAGIFRHDQAPSGHDVAQHLEPQVVNDHASVALPPGYHLESSNGAYHLLDANGKSVGDHIGFDDAGHFDSQTQSMLAGKGWHMQDVAQHYQTTHTEVTQVPSTPHDYISAHPEQFTQVHRDLWYDNNTPKFDLDELKLWWGENGTGVNANGDYVFNVSHMMPGGSFHGDQAVNFQHLIDSGQMKFAISMDRGTQHFVHLVSIDHDGNGVIDHNSFVGQSAFSVVNGHADFHGGFAEAVQVTGPRPDGTTGIRMLATVVGGNHPTGGIDSITHVITDEHDRIITTLDAPIMGGNNSPIEIPFVLPIYGRRGLENLRAKQSRIYYNYSHDMYGLQDRAEIYELIDDTIPALLDNPQAEIPMNQAVDHYADRLQARYGDEYPEELRQIIQGDEVLRAIGSDTKAIITIPVEGIGEADRIYNTLKLYASLSEDELRSSTVLLHLNWMESNAQTPEALAALQKTRDEIARARRDFPSLRVGTFESSWTDEQAAAGGGVIGLAVRRLYDVAILSVREGIQDGRIQPDQEIVMVRNDADPSGFSPGYVANMVTATTQPGRDVTVGKFKWDVKGSAELPGLIIATQFLSGIQNSAERAMRLGIGAGVPTSGANMGVRISVLASVGSVGFGTYTGAGSDDIHLGERINALRQPNSRTRQVMYYRKRGGEYSGSISPGISGGASGSPFGQTTAANASTSTIGRGPGLVIDTNASRLERMYRSGESVVKAWLDFDDRGYKPRDAGLDKSAPGESLDDDPGRLTANIEFQINTLIAGWAMSTPHVEMELKRLFPSNRSGEEPMYTTHFNDNGIIQFGFTESGKRLLIERLSRNNRGEPDPIGSRRVRVNYGGGTRRRAFPAGRTPHLLGV